MKAMKIIRTTTEEEGRKFLPIATAMVNDEVTGTDDENKKVIAMLSARDMAIGARFVRNEYIGFGVIVGIIATAGVIKLMKKKDESKEEVEEEA